jgi:WD repeat-containing protein 89
MDSSGAIIASGHGSRIRIWDLRAGKLKYTYDDAHTDDVTQARFEPSPNSRLVTSSVDGLICVLDASKPDLDDALNCVLSVGVSVGRIGFAGKETQQLWCLTHIEGMQIWSLASEERLVCVEDMRPSLAATGSGRSVDYLVGCFYRSDSDLLYVIGGDDDGGAGVWSLGPGGPAGVGQLWDAAQGHGATVRAADWDFAARKVLATRSEGTRDEVGGRMDA